MKTEDEDPGGRSNPGLCGLRESGRASCAVALRRGLCESRRSYCVMGIVVEYRCPRRHGTAGCVDTRQQQQLATLPLSQALASC